MLDGFAGMGGYTWSLIILLIVLTIGSFIATRGLWGYIIGGVVSAGAVGAMAQIIAYRGTRMPVLDTSWGMTVAMAVLLILAVNLLYGWKSISASPGASGNFRGRIPTELNTKAIAAIAAGVVFLAVSLGFFVNNLDITFGESNRGAEIAENQFSDVNKGIWRSIERFLAR